jgi:hypothetical protein
MSGSYSLNEASLGEYDPERLKKRENVLIFYAEIFRHGS